MSSNPSAPRDPAFEPLPPQPVAEPLHPNKTVVLSDEAGKFTRAGALWTALIVGFVVLILLLVFILQNGDPATIHMFGWAADLPQGVALLMAAIAGGLLTFLVGTARILQLRRAAKKNLKAGL
jgi:uncharacterized integral membrane protein